MIMETKYNIGDVVYASYPDVCGMPLTIGQVRKCVTDSPGIPDNSIFDNFKPKRSVEEAYMCIETGIGGGSIYPVERLFLTKEEARQHLDQIEEENRR